MERMKIVFKIIGFIFHLTVFLLASFLMFCIAYYFTWTLLIGSFNWGNDISFAITMVDLMSRFYPVIPKWNYAWTGGMPFLDMYPPLATVITFFYHKFSGLTVIQVIRLFCWLSVPIAASGIVLLGKLVTRSWLIGILAGAMMFFSPDTWLWITQGGFYAFALSVPFFSWSLALFVLALKKDKKFLWLIAIIAYAFTWLAHVQTAVIITLVFFILAVGFYLQEKKGFWQGFLKFLMTVILGILLICWWFFPFYFGRSQGMNFGPEQIPFLSLKEMVGLVPAYDGVYVTSTFFTASVVILFFVGSLAAFFRKSFVRVLVIACFLAIFIITAPSYMLWLVARLLLFWTVTNYRAVLILRIFGPIIAAYGGASLARPIFWLIEKKQPKFKKNFIWKNLNALCGGVVAVAVFWYLVLNVVVIPPFKKGKGSFYQGFGPLCSWANVQEQEGKLVDVGREVEHFPKLDTIPKIIISGSIKVDGPRRDKKSLIKAVSEKLKLTCKDRIDISPLTGIISSKFTSCSTASVVSHYVGTSLIPRMIGWQVDCFYQEGFCGLIELEDLARWFGISWVWPGTGEKDKSGAKKEKKLIDESNLFKYVETDLEIEGPKGFEKRSWHSYQFLESTGLASISNKPTILVIGDNPPNNDVFHKVFRILSKIDFGYQYAWPVKGKRFIDDYKLKELSKFEILFLHGYQYRNYKKAWNLLAKYLENGGKVFINTGWQYKTPEWGREKEGKISEIEMPGIFPVSRTVWSDIGREWEKKDWDSPLWDDKPWGMALAKEEWLREGAVPLLINQDKILAVSWSYGQGKVVWTGFDFCGHLAYYDGTGDEKKFFKNIFSDLTDNQEIWEEKLDFERPNPDLIKIAFNSKDEGNKLLFKEVANINWRHAYVNKSKLPVYQAGPYWRMVFMPNEVEKGEVVFKYEKAWFEWLGIILAVLSAVGLALYLTGITDKIKINIEKKATVLFKNKFKNFKAKWNSDVY